MKRSCTRHTMKIKFSESSCAMCDANDIPEMVMCERCVKWYHFTCVNVTQDVEYVRWFCPACDSYDRTPVANKDQIPVELNQLSNVTSLRTNSVRTGSKISSRRSHDLELQLLSEEQQLVQKQAEARERRAEEREKRAEERERMELEFLAKKRTIILDAASVEDETVASNASHTQERTSSWVASHASFAGLAAGQRVFPNVNQEEQTRQTIRLGNSQRSVHSEHSRESWHHVHQPSSVILPPVILPHVITNEEMLENAMSSVTVNPPSNARVPVNTSNPITNGQLYPNMVNQSANVPNYRNMANSVMSGQFNAPMAYHTAPAINQSQFHNAPMLYGPNNAMPATALNQPQLHNAPPMVHGLNSATYVPAVNQYQFPTHQIGTLPEPPIILNQAQRDARLVIGVELPIFTGRPEEWPIFISSYENTNKICGFTDTENLIRLQRSLKGHAREAVGNRLFLPASVPGVIESLRLLFGRPEIMLQELIEKVRRETPPHEGKLETIIQYSLSVENLVGVMEASFMEQHLQNPLLLQELINKLPASFKLQWAMQMTTEPSNLSTFSIWLKKIAVAASTVTMTLCVPSNTTTKDRFGKAGGTVNAHSIADVEEDLKPLTREERWELVNKRKICHTCFGSHLKRVCKKKTECGQNGCILTHHPLLHNYDKPPVTFKRYRQTETSGITNISNASTVENKAVNSSPAVNSSGSSDVSTNNTCNAHQRPSSTGTLFRIVPVTLFGKKKQVNTFAFLDEGSSLTMINNAVARELELEGTPQTLCLRWTGDQVREESESQIVSFDIAGRTTKSQKYLLKNVRTVNSLSLPRQTVATAELIRSYPYLAETNLIDYTDAIPTVLIGVDNSKLCLPTEIRQGDWGQPVAMNTKLGWTVHGNSNSVDATIDGAAIVHHSFHICRCNLENDLHVMVEKFFSLDNFGVQIPKVLESEDDIYARRLLEDTTVRINERFRTGLLWKAGEINLPDSLPMAKQRLKCLVRKMESNPDLANNLKEQIAAYVEKGYARKLTQKELEISFPRTWYLPVFVVINPNKPGKVRMVWDAAAEVNGVSLNSKLLKGPDQLLLLPQILYGFRQGKIAIGGDIKEMFHQVQIHSTDQHAQRFLWPSEYNRNEPDVYVMQVMTFGATCSPSSAHYAKNRNASEYASQYPRAAKSIIEHHYVDDMLDSVDTVEEAITLAKNVRKIHKHGGFEIRNWMSNSDQVLEALGEPTKVVSKEMNVAPVKSLTKVLGMWWQCDIDTFTYSTKFGKFKSSIPKQDRKPTKREVLRMLMMVFDPLGFLSAFLVYLKILLQDIWRSGIDWDDAITEEHNDRWHKWLLVLDDVENIKIPRCYTYDQPLGAVFLSTQLHIFVDASENAYAAVAYLRFESATRITCALVGSKTKVAPKNPTSIPRLELLAATLGARFATDICARHNIGIDKRVFWSDSKTVLCWLRADPRKFRQFVAFRVGEILELTDVREWRWISTKENVADEATKWSGSPRLSSTSRWFIGPEFLRQSENTWIEKIFVETPVTEELRSHMAHTEVFEPCTVNHVRFSCWRRLYNAQACVLRVAQNIILIARHNPLNLAPRTASELLRAKNMLYQRAQYDAYLPEIARLQSGHTHVDKRSVLFRLSPYLDELGTLRLRGRIDAVENISGNVKRPIILPKEHYISQLIATYFHEKYHHLQQETALNELRQSFMMFQDRRLMKSIRSRCQKCKNQSATPQYPEMAPLPKTRLAAFKRPFSHVGVDCFGPFMISIGRRTEKRWGMLFTCLTVRAVHLEVAHSLSRESCIICIRNFIARRGQPLTITSDNGTNFHGANNELRRAFLTIQDEHAPIQIRWNFNPPATPHMGGSWERLVGSIKKVLCQIMPTTRLPTEEVFQAALIEAENIVNSRPLTFVSLPHEDAEALTPNHFLLGSSNGNKPPGTFDETDLLSRSAWKKSQHIANEFWKRWVREYLPTLTKRTKWFQPTKNVAIGDVVLITDENLPRNTWPKGIITSITVGRDNIVRRAMVKTQFGNMERPVVKLAVLDVYKKQDQTAI